MAKYKKRVEWGVRLQHYNLKEGDDLHPRAVLRGTLDVHDLALILEENSRGIYRAADTELIVNQLMSVARDALVDGYALNTPMGRLTPVVRGMWNFNRINPAARAQNQASLSYALSTELKKAFEDPLFHVENSLQRGPFIFDIRDMESGTHNERLTPGGYVFLKGRLLLMNGDSPLRGVELLDAETEEVIHHFPAAELGSMNTRSRLFFRLPKDLPDGTYRLAVSSQCCIKPTPLKEPVRWVDHKVLRVGEEPAEEEDAVR